MNKKQLFIILLLSLPIVLQAQIQRDVREFLSDIELEQPHVQPSIDFRKYEYLNSILQPSMPSLPFSEKYNPIFNPEQLQLKPQYKLFKSMNYSIWKPTNKLFIEGKNIGYKSTPFFPANLTGLDLKTGYRITNKLSINGYGYYIANNYKNPTVMQSTLYRAEIGTNLSYNITKNLKIRAGMQYQYNAITRRWEYMFCTGIALDF